MIDQDLKKMKDQAVDLGQARERSIEADATKALAAQRKAEQQIVVWDRAMQRAFKGIVARPQRRRMLEKAVARVD